MPLIRGNTGGGKPIVRVALIPTLSKPSEVSQAGAAQSMHMLECRALLDTGADGMSVCKSVAHAASLRYYGKMPVVGIGGQNYHRAWVSYVGFFPENQPTPFVLSDPVLAVEIPDNNWFEVIIGRDMLSKGTFIMRPSGEFELDIPDQA